MVDEESVSIPPQLQWARGFGLAKQPLGRAD